MCWSMCQACCTLRLHPASSPALQPASSSSLPRHPPTGAGALRLPPAAARLAAAAAARRPAQLLCHDRARGGLLRRHQHPGLHRAPARRQLPAQRQARRAGAGAGRMAWGASAGQGCEGGPTRGLQGAPQHRPARLPCAVSLPSWEQEVVGVWRMRPALRCGHIHGQERPGGAAARAAEHGAGAHERCRGRRDQVRRVWQLWSTGACQAGHAAARGRLPPSIFAA